MLCKADAQCIYYEQMKEFIMTELLLRIKNIKKQYRDKKNIIDAVKGISLDIYKGEIFGLLGPNGAGKTTLSSMIASLHPPTSGDIEFEGQSIYNNLIAYRKVLSFCPQKPNFEKALTVEENLIFAGRYFGMLHHEITTRAAELMEQFGLTSYAQSSPDILSGGYKQRLLIARSLMHKPKLVILDEPTVGMDPHIRRQLWKIIRDLKQTGVTILLTTHYLDEAEALSDRICILDKGSIVLLGTPEALKAEYGKKRLEDLFVDLIENN